MPAAPAPTGLGRSRSPPAPGPAPPSDRDAQTSTRAKWLCRPNPPVIGGAPTASPTRRRVQHHGGPQPNRRPRTAPRLLTRMINNSSHGEDLLGPNGTLLCPVKWSWTAPQAGETVV